MASSLNKRLIGSSRRIFVTETQRKEMHALYKEGMTPGDIGKRLNLGQTTVRDHLDPDVRAKTRACTKRRNSRPDVVFEEKLRHFNHSFLPPAPGTRNVETQLEYDRGYINRLGIYKKLHGFLYDEGETKGINMTIKLKELMDKLWPGEDNGSEKIGRKTVLKRTNFWTKCALSGRDIDLGALKGKPGESSLDHERPRSKGGLSDLDNCQPLSTRMNQMKGNMTNKEFKEEIKFLYERFFLS